jgi:hypothetical protein
MVTPDRAGGRFDTEIDDDAGKEKKLKTKIIAIAELEGICTTLAILAASYNMIGVTLSIVSFDQTYYESLFGVYTIRNNATFQTEFLDQLAKNSAYRGIGCTALLPTLRSSVDYINTRNEKTLLIIATDGQPNEGGNTPEIIAYLDPILKDDRTLIPFIFTIGAGSIDIGTSACNGNKRFEICSRYTKDIASMQRASSVVRGECNNLFLIEITSLSEHGLYCPACTDYSELTQAVTEFVNDVTPLLKFYKTVLSDSGVLGNLPVEVTRYFMMKKQLAKKQLSEIQANTVTASTASTASTACSTASDQGVDYIGSLDTVVSTPVPAVIVKNGEYGWYLIMEDVQIALNAPDFGDNPIQNIYTDVDVPPILCKTFYELNFMHDNVCESIAIRTENGILTFPVAILNDVQSGLFSYRCRKIICV